MPFEGLLGNTCQDSLGLQHGRHGGREWEGGRGRVQGSWAPIPPGIKEKTSRDALPSSCCIPPFTYTPIKAYPIGSVQIGPKCNSACNSPIQKILWYVFIKIWSSIFFPDFSFPFEEISVLLKSPSNFACRLPF